MVMRSHGVMVAAPKPAIMLLTPGATPQSITAIAPRACANSDSEVPSWGMKLMSQ